MPDETTNDANDTNQDIPFVGVGFLADMGQGRGEGAKSAGRRPDTRHLTPDNAIGRIVLWDYISCLSPTDFHAWAVCVPFD
jgi:hypothetical protein